MRKTGLMGVLTLLALAVSGCAPLLIGGAGAPGAGQGVE